jgi:hypothetical protein
VPLTLKHISVVSYLSASPNCLIEFESVTRGFSIINNTSLTIPLTLPSCYVVSCIKNFTTKPTFQCEIALKWDGICKFSKNSIVLFFSFCYACVSKLNLDLLQNKICIINDI